jgi:hypothetical protein
VLKTVLFVGGLVSGNRCAHRFVRSASLRVVPSLHRFITTPQPTGRVLSFEGSDGVVGNLLRFTEEVSGEAFLPSGLASAGLNGKGPDLLVINNDPLRESHRMAISGSYLPFLVTSVSDGGEAEAQYSLGDHWSSKRRWPD